MIDKGQGALLITAHMGSLEVCRALARLRNIRLNVLVHTTHAEQFNRVMRSVNPDQQVELIEVTDLDPSVAIKLRQKLAAGELVVITGDRVPPSGNRFTVAEFLGRQARFPQGPFILAALLKCPVYTLICLSEGDRFHIHLEQLCERVSLDRGNRDNDLQAYVRQFAQRLERYCRSAPLQWFNFLSVLERRAMKSAAIAGWHASVTIDVPFHDVDAMGVVWHGNYPKYFEIARCALLDSIGYNYRQMGESGYSWPVVGLKIRYPRPATFGQRIVVAASIKEYEHRLRIAYLITDAVTGQRLTRGSTIQVAVHIATRAVCFASPPVLLQCLGVTEA